MLKLKRWLATGLVVGLLVTSMLTGCGKKVDNAGQESTSNPAAQSSAVETTAEVVEKKLDPATLIWYIRTAEPKNFTPVMEKINTVLKEKINTTLDIRCIAGAAWKDKVPVMFASGEDMDILWTASYGGFEYGVNVPKGAFLELDDMLAQYAPDLLANYPKGLWDALRIDGKLYAIPNYQKEYTQRGIMARKDLLDKYSIDINSMATVEGLINALTIIKEKEKIFPLMGGQLATHYFGKKLNDAGIFRGPGPEFRQIDTNTWTVLDGTDKDPAVEWHALARELYLKGFITPDALAIAKDTTAEFKTKKYFMQGASYKPGADVDYTNANGFDIVAIPLDDPYVDDASAMATLTAVAKATKNPDRAVMLLNLVNTDKELYNTLIFGLEGQDYSKTGENRVEKVQGAYSLPAWMMGNQFNAYLLPGQADDLWEVTEAQNKSAKPNPLIGFTLDITPIMVETANVAAVNAEFKDILGCGMDDPTKMLAAKYEKERAAGLDKVLAEYQRQLDAWAVKNNKK